MSVPIRHVVWDWNGTLLADQSIVVDSVNIMLADLGRALIDDATYQRLYTRPVRRFYERLLQEEIDDDRWRVIDARFHQAYLRIVNDVALNDQARSALELVSRRRRTQSLLSMAPHDHLVEMVGYHRIGHHFVRVEGQVGHGGESKLGCLYGHLDALAVTDAREVLVIGDSLDDAQAAREVGARVVLFDGGSHLTSELEQCGAPVVPSLLEAIETGLA